MSALAWYQFRSFKDYAALKAQGGAQGADHRDPLKGKGGHKEAGYTRGDYRSAGVRFGGYIMFARCLTTITIPLSMIRTASRRLPAKRGRLDETS